MSFMGVIYSTNGKGRGEMVSLQVYTIKDIAEKRTAAVKPSPKGPLSTERLDVTPIIAVVLGVVGGLLVVVVVICAVLRLHYDRRTRGGAGGGSVSGSECHRDSGDCLTEDAPTCPAKIINTSLKEIPPPPTSPRDSDEKNPDVIPLSDSDSWHIEGVNTISSAAIPSNYASLPRSAHLYSQVNYQQVCPVGSDVNYAELLLCGPTSSSTPSATPGPHQREPQQQVVYATLDHKHLHNPYPHSHPSYPPHASTANNTPKHASHQPVVAATSAASHALLQQQQQLPSYNGHPQGVPWTQTSTLGRTHSLRRDPVHHDPEAAVPLMPNQKESSV
ncbi:hypothetical protein SK128_026616 [Halocaridina rubra]|uniref:Uncharacterized protein n=1 Tax=Halocaridina rubra TaxID=373956 RepID=A0AAN8X879_HALRR